MAVACEDGRVSIHGEHPFLPAEDDRAPVRRLRGRLAGGVTVWTALAGGRPAGLTVSSCFVVEPAQIVGVVTEDSDLLERLEESGRFTVQVLDWAQRDVADEVAGLRPAPGGVFRTRRWRDTEWGPVLEGVTTWAGCTVIDTRGLGWRRLVTAEIAYAEAGDLPDPLVWHRGDYRHLG